MNSKALTIAGLLARGYVETPSTSRKYKMFTRPGCGSKYLLGSAGALRVIRGSEPISASISLTGTRAHKAFQNVGLFAAKMNTVEQNDEMFAGELRNPSAYK